MVAGLAVFLSGGGAAHADAGPPADYREIEGLSQPRFDEDEITTRNRHVRMTDGTEIYVQVTRPEEPGRYPVILESSPYHGTLSDRDGTRILPLPQDEKGHPLGLTGYFAPRGYAVVMMDLRGTGRSSGCLDHLGPLDARDLYETIEWASTRDWSNGRIGMTGHSYVGSTPPVAAAVDAPGLKTIVPSAGLATMYHHQFQAGVPYFLQWVGTMEAYEELALQRKLPPFQDPLGLLNTGDDFGNNMEETGCGLPSSSLVAGEDQLSGRYSQWHAERDWAEGATRADIPVFLVHGVNDNAARVDSIEWFSRRGDLTVGDRDKLWLGQWDHGSGCCPNRRGIQWTKALHAWFDRWLAQRDVETGPPVEIFLADGTFTEAQTGARTEVMTRQRWPGPSKTLRLRPSAAGGLSRDLPAAGEVSFTGDPGGFVDNFATDGATFTTGPLRRGVVLAGEPALDLSASVTAPRVHLIASLFDVYEDPDEGTVRRRISQCAINPELRDGIAVRKPVVPGERYEMAPPCFAVAHHLRAGHELVLRVTTSDPDKVPVFAIDPNVTVFTGPDATLLRVPVVREPVLYPDDVPLEPGVVPPAGTAQPGFRGASQPLAPGAGVRVEGVTSEYFEFDVLDGFDNAQMEAEATPEGPADIDLYLQRQRRDGSWTDDITAAESSSLSDERLVAERLEPGHYRLETHLWAGGPATRVGIVISFLNARGRPGGF